MPFRRRRRRSLTNASPTPARSPSRNKKLSITAHDADGEDNEDVADREDSPEHIYHQIGTDEVVRVSKLSKTNSQSPGKNGNPSDSDKIIITKNSASRRPRVNLVSQGKFMTLCTLCPRQIRTHPKICFYLKIHNFYLIITKLGQNEVFMISKK